MGAANLSCELQIEPNDTDEVLQECHVFWINIDNEKMKAGYDRQNHTLTVIINCELFLVCLYVQV